MSMENKEPGLCGYPSGSIFYLYVCTEMQGMQKFERDNYIDALDLMNEFFKLGFAYKLVLKDFQGETIHVLIKQTP